MIEGIGRIIDGRVPGAPDGNSERSPIWVEVMTAPALEQSYKIFCRELWELEGYDKIGAEVDEARMDDLARWTAELENHLCLPPREKNLI